ncbi:MAG: hypothetical protein ACXVCY_14125 [Pseudobdellovibrionaceae bacterium]
MVKQLLIFTFFTLWMQVQADVCEIKPSTNQNVENLFCSDMSGLEAQMKGLSPLWNLEVMGVDLMKEELKGRSMKSTQLAIIETGTSGINEKPLKSKDFFLFQEPRKR